MQPLLHPQTAAQLQTIQPAARSYIFHGPRGIGKATAARELTRRLNCQGDQPKTCASCRQFQAGAYPDLLTLSPEDKPSITIEQVRNTIHTLSLSPYTGTGTRAVIADDAASLTLEAQNALLKLIEEPPLRTLFILVTEQPESLLATIRSRCAAIYFAPVSTQAIASLLITAHGIPGAQAQQLARAAAGIPGAAVTLATQPETAAAELKLAEQAATAPQLTLFKRLLLAKQLVDDKADIARFGQLMHASLVSKLAEPTPALEPVAAQLVALERFRNQLQAKVTPRVALERLMLEL